MHVRPSFTRLFMTGFALGAVALVTTQAPSGVIPAAVAQVVPR
jgi:hypothetical protein